MPTPESSRELVAATAPQLQLGLLFQNARSLGSVALRCSSASCELAVLRNGVVLGVWPTFCTQATLLSTMAPNNVLVGTGIMILICFLMLLPKLSTSIGSAVFFAAAVLRTDFGGLQCRPEFRTVHGKMLF